MKMPLRKIGFFWLFFLLFFLRLISLSAQEGPFLPREKEKKFSLTASLPLAQAVREREDKVLKGQWRSGRFQFEGLPGSADIFVNDTTVVEGKTRSAIWFQPWPDFESVLVFPSVPPGRQLVLFFALSDLDFEQKKLNPIRFEVWIGKKKIFETRVSSKGWQEKPLDLTLPFLLQRKYRLSFKVQSPETSASNFVFYGYIE